MASLFAEGATPRFVALGTDDKSSRLVPRGVEFVPQHMPKFYIFASKGPMKDQIVSGAAATMLYGSDSFNKDKLYYNHQTDFAVASMGAGQDVMIQRLLPSDIGPRANISIYADILETEIPNYKRDSKGNLVKDNLGNNVVDDEKPTIKGMRLKWITDHNDEVEPEQAGLLTPKLGTMSGSVIVEERDPSGETIQVGTGRFKPKMIEETRTRQKPTGNKIPKVDENGDPVLQDDPTGKTEKKKVKKTITKQVPAKITVDNMITVPKKVHKQVPVMETVTEERGTGRYEEVRTPKAYTELTLDEQAIKTADLLAGNITNPQETTGFILKNEFKGEINFATLFDLDPDAVEFKEEIENLITTLKLPDNPEMIVVNKLTIKEVGTSARNKKDVVVDVNKPLDDCIEIVQDAMIKPEHKDNVAILDLTVKLPKGTDIVELKGNDTYIDTKNEAISGNFKELLEKFTTDGTVKFYKADTEFDNVTQGDEIKETVTVEKQKVDPVTGQPMTQDDPNGEMIDDPSGATVEIKDPNNPTKEIDDPSGKTVPVTEEVEEEIDVPVKVPVMVDETVPENYTVMVEDPSGAQEEIMETVPKMIKVQKELKSRMYPIFEVRAKEYGKAYSNIGFSINSSYKSNFNKQLAKVTGRYPYTFCLYTRENEKASPTVFRSLSSENEVEFFFTGKPTENPIIRARIDMEQVFNTQWYNETDPVRAYRPFDLEVPFIYEDNFNTLLDKIFKNEMPLIEQEPKLYTVDNEYGKSADWYDFDFTGKVEEQKRLLNPFTCFTSKHVPLQSVIIDKSRPELKDNLKEVDMSLRKPIFLQGGSDGTLSNEEFEKAVVKEMRKYADPDSEVMELAYNVESAFWDSGFTLDTKFELLNFISLRKDTFIVMSTHSVDLDKPLTPSQEQAVASALNARFKLHPESTFYGTGVARGLIVQGCGLDSIGHDGVYRPQSKDLLIKTSRFAGAATGKWNKAYLFDRGERCVIDNLKDIYPAFIPQSQKASLWMSNIVYSQRYDRSNYFFPALQTVYDNETSVLNNYFTIMGICTVTKEAFNTWKAYSGSIDLTSIEFKDAVERYLRNRLEDKFAGILTAIPVCEITDEDKLRGYSYRLKVKLFANMSKTVCIYTTETYRMGEENVL